MPRPAVSVVESIYAAFARRDMPAVFAAFASDVELRQSTEVPWGGTYQGHEGVKRFMATLTGTIASKVVVERFIDAGDTVVAIGRTQGTVNATGRAFDVPIAHFWEVREGRVKGARFCIDNPTMLASLG